MSICLSDIVVMYSFFLFYRCCCVYMCLYTEKNAMINVMALSLLYLLFTSASKKRWKTRNFLLNIHRKHVHLLNTQPYRHTQLLYFYVNIIESCIAQKKVVEIFLPVDCFPSEKLKSQLLMTHRYEEALAPEGKNQQTPFCLMYDVF
jgi:hypothetical protein